ncbi:gonadotropin-releasing hormone receptor-like [Osmerus mordax]|uniref:gonadotropin-releasing hormone receptor-like n=1 Tax=Osmerus mordax TaxID=8014 RepID=UPI00350F4CA1
MNTSTAESVVTTCPQTMRYELNTSCNWSWPLCNWTSSGDRLLLPTFSTAAKVRVIITFIVCIISAFCNLAVLWTSNGKNKRKSHVRVLILNLTVADLLVTFIVMPVDAVWNITVQWLAGDFACRLLMFLKLQAMYSCAFVTVVISLDRQSAILNPLAINKARRRNKFMLTVAWLMSIALSVPQLLIFHNVTITFPEEFTQCTTRGSFFKHWHETAYNMFTFSCLFLLPLVIMITCYTRILIEISRMMKDNFSSNEVHLRRSKNNVPKARMRTLKMSIVIVLSFIICWTPYYLLGLWYWFFPEDLEGKVSHSLTHILFIFGLFNACLDPIIYGLFTIHFRKGLKRYYHNATRMSEIENNTAITGSFRCSATYLALKRHATDRQERRQPSHVQTEPEPTSSKKVSYLTIYNDHGGVDLSRSSPDGLVCDEEKLNIESLQL